jgi:hypothetical protein
MAGRQYTVAEPSAHSGFKATSDNLTGISARLSYPTGHSGLATGESKVLTNDR